MKFALCEIAHRRNFAQTLFFIHSRWLQQQEFTGTKQ